MRVGKFISSQTPITNHIKIEGKQKPHTWSICIVMVWTCRVVHPHRGEVRTCPPQVHQAHLEAKEPTIQVKTLGTPCWGISWKLPLRSVTTQEGLQPWVRTCWMRWWPMLWGIMKLTNQRDSVQVNKCKSMTFCCGIWPMMCINAK